MLFLSSDITTGALTSPCSVLSVLEQYLVTKLVFPLYKTRKSEFNIYAYQERSVSYIYHTSHSKFLFFYLNYESFHKLTSQKFDFSQNKCFFLPLVVWT